MRQNRHSLLAFPKILTRKYLFGIKGKYLFGVVSAYLGFDCFVCVFMIWFSCFVVCLCIFVFWFSRCCWFSFVLQEQHVFPSIPTYYFWRRNSKATPLQIGSQEYQINHHPNAKKHCKQFVELARCERVRRTQAEFHFSWAYTFSATPRSLRIWATHPLRETGCDPAPLAQLCWSSSSSFPYTFTTTSWNWTVTKLIYLLKGIDSTTFRFLQCPGVLALICVFSSRILIIAK